MQQWIDELAKEEKEKTTRGSSPRGEFEKSKAYALAEQAAQAAKRQIKTEALRALRLGVRGKRETDEA
ncbi:hypothetical protein [Pararhizobium gei]|uniref:hypothetical protein n=1 Tax=Pararhizobium gei TaxID=1395951 RepID=UPI0023DB1C7A|nr:hypothetical protein [Rhizobium gei]